MKLKDQVKIYAMNKDAKYDYQDTLLKNVAFKMKYKKRKEAPTAEELVNSL